MIIRDLGLQPYHDTWKHMQTFTASRDSTTEDEVWLLEHEPVYTLGQAANPSHLLQNPQQIPVVRTNRGGQITYHGPGQLIIYPLIDLHRASMSIRDLISQLEQLAIDLLAHYHILGKRNQQMPGIYIDTAKFASIGIRVSRGCSLHGMSMNINMDLTPFHNINPCGQPNQTMYQLADHSKASLATAKAFCQEKGIAAWM